MQEQCQVVAYTQHRCMNTAGTSVLRSRELVAHVYTKFQLNANGTTVHLPHFRVPATRSPCVLALAVNTTRPPSCTAHRIRKLQDSPYMLLRRWWLHHPRLALAATPLRLLCLRLATLGLQHRKLPRKLHHL
jgi:hypothetical protein